MTKQNFLLPLFLIFTVAFGCGEQTKTTNWQNARSMTGNLDHPRALAADGDYLYFVTGGTIASLDAGTAGVWRLKLTGGGEPEQIVKGKRMDDGKVILPETFRILVDDKYVYWSSGTIWRTPKAGGESERLAPASPTLLETDGQSLFWVNFGGENAPPRPVFAGRKDSAESAPLTKPIHSSGLAVEEGFVYWAQKDGIYKIAKGGGSESRIFSAGEKTFVSGLTADSGNLYFTLGDGRNSLYKIAKTGGEPVKLAENINSAMDFISDGGFVYFVRNEGSFGTALVKVPTAGGEVTKLNSGHIATFTVGKDRIFISDVARIYSLEK